MNKIVEYLKNDKFPARVGELGVYIYMISLMYSKGKMNIGLGFMIFGFLLKLWRREKFTLLKEEKIILAVLLITPVFSLLSPGGIKSAGIAFQKNYRYFGIFLIPMFVSDMKILKRTVFFILASFGINFIKAISIWKKNGVHFPYTRYVSFGGNTLNESHMNAMLICLVLALVIYTIKKKNIIYKLGSTVLFVLVSVVLILGQGRGAWLGALAGFIVMSFLAVEDKKKYLVGLLLFTLLGVGSLKIPAVKNSYYVKRAMSIKNTTTDGSNVARLDLWKASIAMYKQHPIFGVGRDNSPKYFKEYLEKANKYEGIRDVADAGNAHSMYFTSLGEQGLLIFGFIYMFVYMFLAQVKFLLTREKNSFTYCVTLGTIGMLVAFCVGGLTENNWQDFWKSAMVCGAMGIYLGMKKNNI